MNISGLTQDAIRGALARSDTDLWLERLDRLPRTNIRHASVMTALDDARDEFGA